MRLHRTIPFFSGGLSSHRTHRRHRRGGDALMVIETDQHIKPRQVEFLSELPGILSVTYYDKEDDEDGAGFDEGNL